MTTVFTKFDKFRTTEVKVLDNDATWPELAEEFFTFLQGCGYVLTRQDFAEYWEQYIEYNQDNDVDEYDNWQPDCDTCGGGSFEFGLGANDLGDITFDPDYATGGTMANSSTISVGDVTVTVVKNEK